MASRSFLIKAVCRCIFDCIKWYLKFLIVIDEDEVESMEDTLAELAGNVNIKNNHFSTIRQSLHRLVGQRSLEGNDFYYDAVNVLSVNDFSNHLRILA